MNEEFEYKFSFDDPGLLGRIAADPAVAGAAVPGSWKDQVLETTYFDTADNVLQKARLTYRIRLDGTVRVATVKFGGNTGTDGSHARTELNVEAPEGMPELEAFGLNGRSFLERDMRSSELEPLFVSRTDRLSALLAIHGGGVAEFAADRCVIEADGGRRMEFFEIELEVKDADKKETGKLAAYLSGKYGLTPEPRSKYARGLELLTR